LSHFKKKKKLSGVTTLLFCGFLTESKGILILLEAVKLLIFRQQKIILKILGEFSSENIKLKMYEFIKKNELSDYVSFEGVKTGEQYYEDFRDSDIFCFPSFFEAENLPVALLDATKFELPIVATKWRGVPDVVIEGYNGFLVDIKNYGELACKIEVLVNNIQLRIKMGKRSRKLFLTKYSDTTFFNKMSSAFNSILKESK